jgi:predicted outer membrane protein
MNKTHFLFSLMTPIIAGAFVVLTTEHTLAADNGVINSSDKSFLQSAYEDGLAEIHMAGLGVKKTGNAELKAFAEKLEADHGKAKKTRKSAWLLRPA